jgi:SET domain-containing protein
MIERSPSPRAGRARRPPRYRVGRSAIHGRGAFAAVAFAPGMRVGEYRGRRIDRAEMERRWRASSRESGHTFFFVIDDDVVIDASEGGNGIRFINHSCAPNCTTVVEEGRVYVEALHRIAPGAELTYDYLLQPGELADAFEHYTCACGAPTCRGTMVDPALLPPRRARAQPAAQTRRRSRPPARRISRTG